MTINKGQTLDDGTYLYTCGTCNGKGISGGTDCPYCYGLDTTKILDAMQKGARGQRYYSLLKAYLSVQGKPIVDSFWEIKRSQGAVYVIDIAYLVSKYGLNFKALTEWLEETHCIPSGMYELIKESKGFKVSSYIDEARKKWGVALMDRLIIQRSAMWGLYRALYNEVSLLVPYWRVDSGIMRVMRAYGARRGVGV